MIQNAITACLPWVVLLLAAIVVGRTLIWLSGARLDLRKLLATHRCEKGSVQSLSFVLTLPAFIMILMLIVQVSQIMMANIVVHYAAFASVRSAVVWIPSNVSDSETANCISSFSMIEQTGDENGVSTRYRIAPFGDKYDKIRQAAILAIAPMGPSRNLGYSMTSDEGQTAIALAKLYRGLDAESQTNSLITQRLENKLAYCYANTEVDVTFWHRAGPHRNYQDPPLQETYLVRPYQEEFQFNELGWQDHITSTVNFDIPLLPGPVRWFASGARSGGVSKTDVNGEVFAFSITASATMVNEGEKPLLSYWQEEFGAF